MKRLRTDFYYFRNAFYEVGGSRLHSTAADALLTYISIYGYDSLRGKGEDQIREALAKTWKEIALAQEERPINVIEDPGQDNSAGLLSRIMPVLPWQKNKIKAAFLYNRDPERSNWALGHEKGRQVVQERLQGKLETTVWICDQDEQAQQVLESAIAGGADVIFVTAAQMLDACLKTAIEHPEVQILNCSLNVPHKYIRTYYPRMYEAKFISGAIAGAMCTNGKIGYICNYPVYGNIAEINAFARGVQMTNAHAQVYLEWSNDSSLKKKTGELADRGIRLISVRDMSRTGDKVQVLYGLQQLEENGASQILVQPEWNWGAYYERILRSILDGSYDAQENKTAKSLNYFWGMSSDVVDIQFSELLPRGIRYLGELICKAIRMGVCRPFYDPTRDENGNLEWQNVKATISMEEIISMDWLEPNVVGTIPSYDQLSETARQLVDAIGVKQARKDAQEPS